MATKHLKVAIELVRVWILINSEELIEQGYCLLLPSRFSRVRLCATPWTAAYQASPSLGFSRQEHLEWVAISFSNKDTEEVHY